MGVEHQEYDLGYHQKRYQEWQKVLKKRVAILDISFERAPSPIDWGTHLKTPYGSLILRERHKELWMVSVKVKEKFRGQGLSKRLLKHSLRLVKTLGHTMVYLDCAPSICRVYEAVGFTQLAPSKYIDGHITMLKRL